MTPPRTVTLPAPAPEPTAGGSLSVAQARALQDSSTSALRSGEWERALGLAQQGLCSALRGRDRTYEAYANYNVGRSLAELGRCDEALPYLERREQMLGTHPGRHRGQAEVRRVTSANARPSRRRAALLQRLPPLAVRRYQRRCPPARRRTHWAPSRALVGAWRSRAGSGDRGRDGRERSSAGLRLARQVEDRVGDLSTRLDTAADVVRFPDPPLAQHELDRPRSGRRRAAIRACSASPRTAAAAVVEGVGDEQRDDLLRELVRPVVVRAVGDRDRQAVRLVVRAHGVVGRRLRRVVRRAWAIRVRPR